MPQLMQQDGETSSRRASAELLVRRLLEEQQDGGGWGVQRARPANTETTAFAALALARATLPGRDTDAARASARAVRWLLGRQRADGSWAYTDQGPGGAWATAPAVLALACLGTSGDAVPRGARWLAGLEGLHWKDTAVGGWRDRLAQLVGAGERPQRRPDMDTSIPGWPWLDGTFSWVEPTALAMLAMRAALRDPAVASERVSRRLQDGQRLLVDRATREGGWNYGNGRALDYDLAPFPDTTAWALLALRGAPGVQPLADRGLATLDGMMRENRSALARSLAVLAMRAFGRDDSSLLGPLAAQCRGDSPDPRVGDARSAALALLALSGSPHPLSVR